MRQALSEKKSEFRFCRTVADFYCTILAQTFRYHPEIVTQRFVALLDVVSNFAAFKIRDQRVGNPPPSHPLPFLQLKYFAAQNIGVSHAAGPS